MDRLDGPVDPLDGPVDRLDGPGRAVPPVPPVPLPRFLPRKAEVGLAWVVLAVARGQAVDPEPARGAPEVNSSARLPMAATRVNRPLTSAMPIANSATATRIAIQPEFGTTKLCRKLPHHE